MTTNLRISLTILTAGFALEGGGELYSFVSGGRFHPGVSLLFVLPVAVTLAGLLFVWVGQHEWNALHRARVRQAHIVFALSLIGGVAAAAVVGVLLLEPHWGTPDWARAVFGVSAGSLVLGTFVTYGLLVFHLVPRPSKALLLASLGWSLIVAGFVGAALASNLPTILALSAHRSFGVPAFLGPVDALASYLFVSYFLLFAAYLDAHRTVVQGPDPRPVPAVGDAPPPGPSVP